MQAEAVQFLNCLRAAGLIEPDEAAVLSERLAGDDRPAAARRLAADLVAAERLTTYQAEAALTGERVRLVIGAYWLIEPIGAGGMGQVFKAVHRHMGRTVALKMLSGKGSEATLAIERFQREVRAAARLSHRNIVTAFDAGEDQGTPYFVMEYVAGRDLSALVRRFGPVSPEQACDYVAQTAAGLAYAHGQGVIHRDIKPANLLLDERGTIKILDMGLARFESTGGGGSATALTGMDDIMGTVDYMSPKQATNTHQADARSDIYSLGCTLHYLLTGEPPYRGETMMNKLLAHRRQPIPSLAAARDDVPPALDVVFARMVAKSPEDRFQSMSEVGDALRECGIESVGPAVEAPPPDDALAAWLRTHEPADDASLSASALAVAGETVAFHGGRTQAERSPTQGGRRLIWEAVGAVAVAGLLFLLFRWLSPAGQIVRNEAMDFETPIVAQDDYRTLDQQVVKWVCEMGGNANIEFDGGHMTNLQRGDQDNIPLVPFHITLVRLSENPAILDKDLARLTKLDRLTGLSLANLPGITDAGLEQLAVMPKLDFLALARISHHVFSRAGFWDKDREIRRVNADASG
jgi:hypothetical protein